MGETIGYQCCRGRHIRNLHLLVTLQAAIQGLCLHDRAGVSVRPLLATWPNKMPRQQYYEVALLNSWHLMNTELFSLE